MSMGAAEHIASKSNFPGRKCGAVIVPLGLIPGTQLALGNNGIPGSQAYQPVRFGMSTMGKYEWGMHAELACIADAADRGMQTRGGTMYSVGSPCLQCAIAIVKAGIQTVFISNADPFHDDDPKWGASIKTARRYLKDSGVEVYKEVA